MRKLIAITLALAGAGFAHGQSAQMIAAQAQQNILNQQAVINRFAQEEEDREIHDRASRAELLQEIGEWAALVDERDAELKKRAKKIWAMDQEIHRLTGTQHVKGDTARFLQGS